MSSFLPPEIVANILSRLPVKPLLRFRCVSKPLCSLIDSSEFVKMHLNQSMDAKSNRNLILNFKKRYVHSIELRSLDSPGIDSIDLSQCLEFKPPVSGFYVSRSCNGLTHMFMKEPEYTQHYIWNPFTRKYKELPPTSFDFQGLELPADIDLRKIEKYLKHGFTYVSETDEYKVVLVTEFWSSGYIGNQASIFSSRSNEWERLEPFPYKILHMRALGVHLNGILHFVVETGVSSWILMVFDTKTKQHSMFPKPDFARAMVDVTVAVFEGKLCLLNTQMINHGYDSRTDIWVMNDYGVEASWFKLLSLVEEPDWDSCKHEMHQIILTYSEDGTQILLQTDNDNDNGKTLIWYNLSDASVRKMTVNGLPCKFSADVCTESLVSLPGFISVDDGKAKCRGNNSKGSIGKLFKQSCNLQ